MTVTVQFDVPAEFEEKLRAEGDALGAQVKEAIALDLYQREQLTFHELSQMLGLDNIQTSELLQRRRIYVGAITMEDLEADRKRLDAFFEKQGQ